MLLADELVKKGLRIDVEKVIRIALLHDWSEVRVGDMPRTATEYFGYRREEKPSWLHFRYC
jgi:putative hydrolase of HD superfamily